MIRRSSLVLLLAFWLVPLAPVCAQFFGMGEPDSLFFGYEEHSGKGDWVIGKLSLTGAFSIQGTRAIFSGTLPRSQSRRIFEEFEKICASSGLDDSTPVRPAALGVPQLVTPFLSYQGPHGLMLDLTRADAPVPPEVLAFLRILWHKLQTEGSKKPDPVLPPIPAHLP